jgi:hypothetical protein
MEGRGAGELERVNAHVVLAGRERKRAAGVGYRGLYFRGMVSGLALAEALDTTVSSSIAPSITDHGYEVEAPCSVQAR